MLVQTRTQALPDLIQRFLASRRQNLAVTTLEYYTTLLQNFWWYCRNQGWSPDISLITRDHLRDFLNYVATEKNRWPDGRRARYKQATPATVHHYGQVVKTFFNWAWDEDYLDNNPGQRLKLGPARYKDVQPYSDEEVLTMLSLCDNEAKFRYHYLGIRNKAIISLFVATGLRLAELSNIKLSDLDPKLRQVRVMGKGAKMRVLPIDGEAKRALKSYLGIRPKGGDCLWKADDGQPFRQDSVSTMIERLKRRAGVNGGGGAHRFRHYFATRFLEAGGNINSLRLLLGHATLSMVLKYSKYCDVQKALTESERVSPLDRLYNRQNNNHSDDGWGWKG